MMWRKCIVKPGDDKSWNQAFEYLFPAEPKEHSKSRMQNYENCGFWVKWQEVVRATSMESALELQSLVKITS
jgi:hypothetical protein